MRFARSVFLFHRDLRVHDNTGLIASLKQSEEVLPIFVIDPVFDQIREASPQRWFFILQSLKDLDAALRSFGSQLYLLKGDYVHCLQQISTIYPFEAIFLNEDYTPLSKARENNLEAFARETNLVLNSFIDYPLVDPRAILTGSKTAYKKFTPYYQKSRLVPVAEPRGIPDQMALVQISDPIFLSNDEFLPESKNVLGGRTQAFNKLEQVVQLRNYAEKRDFPSLSFTSQLSPYIRFGNLSIREGYHFMASQLPDPEALIRQLYWRDFYTYIGFHYPHVFRSNFKPQYDELIWENDPRLFEVWKNGKTGFPIVDAGMRQLNQTGLMHNRVRMIVASFLVKDLLIDWRWGERYFAQKLLDYDPAVNNGSWQWAASTGTDAQPYFRIFNPWRQQQRFDADAVYIKQWVPELRILDAKDIHDLYRRSFAEVDYPEPVVDHKERAEMAKMMFKSL